MYTGQQLGRAIEAARLAKGVTKKALADHFKVTPPSVQDWVRRGTIDKDKLASLWAYFADVVPPSHWGLDRYPTGDEAQGVSQPAQSSPERGNTRVSRDALPEQPFDRISAGPHQVYDSEDSGTLTPSTSSNAALPGLRRPAGRQVVSLLAMDVEASMNDGGIVRWHEDVVSNMGIDEAWLRRSADFTAVESLALVTAPSDDMEPTFSAGDPLLIDRGVNQVVQPSVYMLMLGRKLYIRRMQRMKDDSLMMLADNQKYYAESFVGEELKQLRVLGRVAMAWNSRRI